MKKITLLKQLFTLMLLSGMVMSTLAQDLYLPATTRSKEAKALYMKAVDALYHADLSNIFSYAQQAIEVDPNFFMGYFLQVYNSDKVVKEAAMEKIAAYTGKMNKGEKVLKELVINKKEDLNYKADDAYRQLIKLYPKCIFPRILLVYNLSFDKSTKGEAYDILDEVFQLSPDIPMAYNQLGYMYLSDKEYEKSREAFDHYIEMDSGYANPYDSKGDYFMGTKQYDAAAKSFFKAFEIDNSFTYSKTKGEQAKWMAKRELITKEVLKAAEKMVADYNSMDVKKYLSNYVVSPELSYLYDGHLISSFSDISEIVRNNRTKYSKWFVTVEQTNIEIPDEKIAVVTQKYQHDSTTMEGKEEVIGGFYTTVWRKDDAGWKIINVIDVTTKE